MNRYVVIVLIFLATAAIGGWLRAHYDQEWLQEDNGKPPVLRPWMVESDCYSQLARDQRILHGQGLIQNHFTVENWPEGLVPSTTAPFDYVILLLYAPLTLFTQYPLEWAGAIVSPALWLGLGLFWVLVRSREFNTIGRSILIIGVATLPTLVWATAFGRPRHQSLILALIAIGLTVEYERWEVGMISKRVWHIFAGIIWGLACWTSLFEPTVVVGILVLFNLIVRRRENASFLISFGTVMLFALLLEGVHIFNVFALPAETYNDLVNWLKGIPEVQPIQYLSFIGSITLLSLVFVMPFVAWRLLARRNVDHRVDWLLTLITVVLTVLAFLQQRWLCYASLAQLFLIARYCQVEPIRWTRFLVYTVFILGLFYDNSLQLSAADDHFKNYGPNQPSSNLEQLSKSINQPGGIMAPWWYSACMLYFSGQPIVSGSSHCGITGIIDSAKFFTNVTPRFSQSWPEAERILKERKVRWVLVFDDQSDDPRSGYPALNYMRQILGLPLYTPDSREEVESTVWYKLAYGSPVDPGRSSTLGPRIPTSFRLVAIIQIFKLYEYVPSS